MEEAMSSQGLHHDVITEPLQHLTSLLFGIFRDAEPWRQGGGEEDFPHETNVADGRLGPARSS